MSGYPSTVRHRVPESPKHMAGELRNVARAATPTHLHLRQRLLAIAALTFIADVVGTLLVMLFENDAEGGKISSLGGAAFWTTCQLLTVSSQLPNPVTTGGRIVDVFLEIYAISVVATLAGAWGSFFHRRSLERHPMDHQSQR
jgi:hypothetical protein